MDDRELLELAAKAAGIEIEYVRAKRCGNGEEEVIQTSSPHCVLDGKRWNPLTDDGDALRLAVKLRLDVMFSAADVEVTASLMPDGDNVCPWSWFALLPDKDNNAAVRRAIVQAAAEVGKRPNTVLSGCGHDDANKNAISGPQSA